MSGESAPDFLILSDDVLSSLGLTTLEIVEAIEAAIRSQRAGAIWTTPKSALRSGDGRYMTTTLAASDAPGIIAVKSVMVSPRNPSRGLNGVEGCLLLQDSETGLLLAVMQAGWITGVRTAGLSAAAARRLADPRSAVIALAGAGRQARSHLRAFADLFPLAEARIFGRGRANVDRLSRLAGEIGLRAVVCDAPRQALEGADIVVSSVTLSQDLAPFLDARWLKPGAFAAIADAAVSWRPERLDAFDVLLIDDREQERNSQRKLVAPELADGDLPDLLTGRAGAAFDPRKRSAFAFRGAAVGDFAVASLAFERAIAAGAGRRAGW